MRLGTLILPVCFLCLLAGVIWPTGHAVPGLLSELRDLSIDIHKSPDDFVLWISVAWGAIRALLTFALLVLAGQIWLGLAYAVCLQLCRGLRSPAAQEERTTEETAQPGPSELPQSPNRQARRREYHLRNEEEARIRANTPYEPPPPRPDSPEYIAGRQAAADELRREGEERTAADEAHKARAAAHEAYLAELRRNGPRKRWQQQ